jgi:hypothetical protein
MSLPSGILLGGKVFQVPPPAVEARAFPEASGEAGWAGKTGTGMAVGGGEARATMGAAGVAATIGGGVAGGGEGVAITGSGVGAGVDTPAIALAIPAVAGFSTMTGCVGAGEDFGAGVGF